MPSKWQSDRLTRQLGQAGLIWTPAGLYIRAAVLGAMSALVFAVVLGMTLLAAVCVGAFAGLALLHVCVWRVSVARMRYVTQQLPCAIDAVIRGLQAGRTVTDSLRIAAKEAQTPVRQELTRIIDDLAAGKTIEEAHWRFSQRIPVPEGCEFALTLTRPRSDRARLEALRRLNHQLRARAALNDKNAARSAKTMSGAAMVVSVPLAIGWSLAVARPAEVSLLSSQAFGVVFLSLCAVCCFVVAMVVRHVWCLRSRH
ncbi:MAG: type II secretion system F family protein [Pseudomonadota bacterium]